MKNRFCVSKKIIFLVFLLGVVLSVFYLINIFNNQNLSKISQASPSLSLPVTDCSKYNLFEPVSAKDRIKDYCKNLNGEKYKYGGGWGINAICYSRSKTCATSSICKTESCLRCLNERVEVINCINAKVAPTNALSAQIKCPQNGDIKYGWGQGNNCYSLNGGIKYRSSGEPYCANTIVEDRFCCTPGSTNPKCPQPSTVIATAQPIQVSCSGQTCNGTAIGSCPQGYLRRCTCVNNLARFVDDQGCGSSITPTVAKCSYAGKSITTSTNPYKYIATDNFCIYDASGNRVGAKCQSSGGTLINGNAKNDTVICPKPTTGACIRNDSKWKTDKTTCEYGKNKYLPYGQCLGNYKCKCDDQAKYSYPTLQSDASCP